MYTPLKRCPRSNFVFMKNSNIMVSGAAGQSGTLILRALAARQQPVRALVRDTTKAKDWQRFPV